jgi:lysophospholipase L1-like esterase
MFDRSFSCVRALGCVIGGTLLGSCGSPKVVGPTTSDPPALSCPADMAVSSIGDNPVPVIYTDPTITGGQSPFTLACSPVSGAIFKVDATIVTCRVTDAQQRPASCQFTVTVDVSATPLLAVTRFVAFGDSITAGEDGQFLTAQSVQRSHPLVLFPDFQAYPGALKQMLAGHYTTQSQSIVVFNAGQSGEEVTGAGTQTRFSQTIAGGAYDVVLIMEGANDLSHEDAAIEPDVITGLGRMIVDAKQRHVRPYLATIPPENPDGCCPVDRGKPSSLVPGFNDRVRALASDQGVPLVDVYAALNGDVNTYIGPDGLHPTVQGYAKIAATFFDRIEQTLEEQPARATTIGGGLRVRPTAPAAALPSTRTSPPVRR